MNKGCQLASFICYSPIANENQNQRFDLIFDMA